MDNIEVLISQEELEEKTTQLARIITEEYQNEDLVLICILKGAVYFAIDLSRKIENQNLILDFMKVGSYGEETVSSGQIDLKYDLSNSVEDKNVIIVEDIIDTGYTLEYLKNYLALKKPKSIKICVLLDKEARRKVNISPDYYGFKIPDEFVVGYGLDYKDKYRNLPYVGYVRKRTK